MKREEPVGIEQFERGEIDPAGFTHAEHIRIGYMFLLDLPFTEVLPRYARGIRQLARKAAKADLYNETITTAFLSLIAERMQSRRSASFDEFKAANRDLFDKAILNRRYSAARLSSVQARSTFLLPDLAETG